MKYKGISCVGFETAISYKISAALSGKIYRQISKNVQLDNKETTRFNPSSKMRRTSSGSTFYFQFLIIGLKIHF